MFYEVIFETGNSSVANYESDEEATEAIKAHHDRAKRGLPAQATNTAMGPAERVSKVLRYDRHPADYNDTQTVKYEDVEEALSSVALGDLVSAPELAAAVRELTSPVKPTDDPHESNYKMQDSGELTGWDE